MTELTWMLSTVTPMGLLERCTSYKDKIAKGKVGCESVAPDPNGRLTDTNERIRPKAPVLIIAPGDLHQQIAG